MKNEFINTGTGILNTAEKILAHQEFMKSHSNLSENTDNCSNINDKIFRKLKISEKGVDKGADVVYYKHNKRNEGQTLPIKKEDSVEKRAGREICRRR